MGSLIFLENIFDKKSVKYHSKYRNDHKFSR